MADHDDRRCEGPLTTPTETPATLESTLEAMAAESGEAFNRVWAANHARLLSQGMSREQVDDLAARVRQIFFQALRQRLAAIARQLAGTLPRRSTSLH